MIIYKLTVEATVEERILDLQNKKRELAEQAIEGGMRKEAFKLGLNEIIDLFRPGSAQNPLAVDDGASESSRRGAATVRRQPGRPKREESAVYGRRW